MKDAWIALGSNDEATACTDLTSLSDRLQIRTWDTEKKWDKAAGTPGQLHPFCNAYIRFVYGYCAW